jgi:hypothetical protein
MVDMCIWMVFQAHPTRFAESEDEHPDFFGVFVCQASRREPELLLGEILGNRKLFLTEIRETRSVAMAADWGMNERLKTEVNEHGYGLSLTKIQQGTIPSE